MSKKPTPATRYSSEQVLDGNPFELIDSPFAEGKMERWRANAMATGTMGYLAQVYEMVRNDAAALEEKTAALDAKKSAVLSTVNRLLKFMSRVDALTSRVEALEAKHKADEATQRKLDEEPIELPPDIAEYQTRTPLRRRSATRLINPVANCTPSRLRKNHRPSFLNRHLKPKATTFSGRSMGPSIRQNMIAIVERLRMSVKP